MTRAADDFSGLTAAFLGDSSAPRAPALSGGLPTLLIVGNVPTLSGIWISQYADQQAKATGPLALIRLDGAASRGEIYRAQGRALPVDGGAWLERASAFAQSWIVCADAQSDPAAFVQSGCPLVLLSGTDETAIAAAKRTLESIAQACSALGGPAREVGLAFVGSLETSAQAAFDSLTSWSRERALDLRLKMGSHSPRVDRVESTGPIPLAMLGSLDAAAALELIGLAMQGSSKRYGERDRAQTRPVAEARAPTFETPARVSSGNSVAAPQESARKESSADIDIIQTYFGEWTALAFRCPDATSVRLAIDTSGTLHLVEPSSAANPLRVATGWARANWMLLCAACATLGASEVRVVEHMLLDDAREAAVLHRAGVMLHARVSVTAGGAVIRARVDLNTPESAGLSLR